LILFGNDGAEKAAERIMQIADQALNKMTESQPPQESRHKNQDQNGENVEAEAEKGS